MSDHKIGDVIRFEEMRERGEALPPGAAEALERVTAALAPVSARANAWRDSLRLPKVAMPQPGSARADRAASVRQWSDPPWSSHALMESTHLKGWCAVCGIARSASA